jgi:hypothetical protein
MAFANTIAKYHYDKRYKSLIFVSDDFAFLRLYNDYFLDISNNKINRKLDIQRVESFRIIRLVGRNAYELKIDNFID